VCEIAKTEARTRARRDDDKKVCDGSKTTPR